jgi:class 3 adenylate cyclase
MVPMTRRPEVRYAWNGEVALAFQVFGARPVDLVYLQGYTSHVDLNWESAHLARFLRGLGDRARAIACRYRGESIHTTGDGLLATFDGPARAVRCAQAIIEAGRPLGVEIRAGLHTGEHELKGVPDRWRLYRVVAG